MLILTQEEIAQLLRYESSTLPEGEVTSLQDYVKRNGDQRHIFYICAPRYERLCNIKKFKAVWFFLSECHILLRLDTVEMAPTWKTIGCLLN